MANPILHPDRCRWDIAHVLWAGPLVAVGRRWRKSTKVRKKTTAKGEEEMLDNPPPSLGDGDDVAGRDLASGGGEESLRVGVAGVVLGSPATKLGLGFRFGRVCR
jgi:hypothetical protein